MCFTEAASTIPSRRSCIGPCWTMRGACGPRLTRARHDRPTERRGPATKTPRMGPHGPLHGEHMHPLVGAARPMRAHARPMRGAADASPLRAKRPTERRGPAARTPRMGPACRCMGSACHVAHTLRVGAARPMRAHARPMRLAADAGPPPTNGRCLPSRPDERAPPGDIRAIRSPR